MPRYGHAVLGGTFDRLHVGHAALLGAAFAAGRRVSIGLTTDRFVRASGKPRARAVEPFQVRARALRRWLRGRYGPSRWRIVPLDDAFGGSTGDGVDVLVVSAETAAGGRRVNRERRRLGRPQVPIVRVPLVLADDLRPVSSRRIRAGEIDPAGRRLAPLRVGAVVIPPEDAPVVLRAIRDAIPSARVRACRPTVAALRGTPRRRAVRAAALAAAGSDLGVGAVRRRGGGWAIAERAGAVALDGRPVAGRRPADLYRSLVALLAPRRPKRL